MIRMAATFAMADDYSFHDEDSGWLGQQTGRQRDCLPCATKCKVQQPSSLCDVRE